jgi:hypothetical protein
MKQHVLGLAILAAVVSLVAATGATARQQTTAASSAVLYTTPFVYKGYSWSLTVTDGGASGADTLTLSATKRAGKALQTHSYSFSSGVSFTVIGKLASAKLTGSLGPFGTLKAFFKATGPLKKSGPPPGCTGPNSTGRAGALSGFGLVADTTFFKRVAKQLIHATLSLPGTGQLSCGVGAAGPPPKTPGSTSLLVTQTGAETLLGSVTKAATGAVTEAVVVTEDKTKTAPASITHLISTPAPGSAFTVADNLTSAHATGVAPFLSGALDFTGVAQGTTALGQIAGDFAAQFDSIGPRSLTGTAILVKS